MSFVVRSIFTFVLFFGATAGASVAVESQVTSDEALILLKEGNRRFVQGKSRQLLLDTTYLETLATRQRPFAVVLSCSDSRVPPEIVFNQGIGDLFIIRVAGEVLDGSTIASIEYGIQYLGAHLIVVLGHESCGAVESALKAHPSRSAGSAELDNLLASVYLEAKKHHTEEITSKDPFLRKAVMHHVDQVSLGLAARSKIVQKRLENGTLKIARGIYSLRNGEVQFWDAKATPQSKPNLGPSPEAATPESPIQDTKNAVLP